jgi:hypothetical protein
MSEPSREEELGRGQRGSASAQGDPAGPAPAAPGLIVWVVTRRLEHETLVLGVTSSEATAAEVVETDIDSEDFPPTTVVRYHVQSHAVT